MAKSGGGKKINPRNRPATQEDVRKAADRATNEALDTAWALFFTALRDSEGYGKKRLRRVWEKVVYLSDSVAKGYISVRDLMAQIQEETGIDFKDAEGKK